MNSPAILKALPAVLQALFTKLFTWIPTTLSAIAGSLLSVGLLQLNLQASSADTAAPMPPQQEGLGGRVRNLWYGQLPVLTESLTVAGGLS